ncbi:protein-L-isoaspartate O-methyltransferase family protein [Benzoatithermus flavus]|uniref:Protein-L-isoaspartate O-methyltransferase n=1 Tax=Benzoatithermus flavus TaxID=3108223 RepID=A0ABU8XML6_9PROT
MIDYAVARHNMVENQLRPNQIDDPRVLDAMGEIPRELFVPKALRGVAYSDEDLDLGQGRFLIEPLALAKLIQAASPRSEDVALVVGDVTGYAAAVLSRLVATVFLLVPPAVATEPVETLLSELGCDNVVLRQGDAMAGHPAQAPYDLILLAGSVPSIPSALIDQLAENGRLVAVVEHGRSGKVTVARKVNGAVGRLTPFDARIFRLPGFKVEAGFQF